MINSCDTFTLAFKPLLVVENVPLYNNQKAYHEHQNSDPVNDMHSLNIDVFRPVRILFAKEILTYLTKLKEALKPTFILISHMLKFINCLRGYPNPVFLNQINEFIYRIDRWHIPLDHVFASV